MIAPNQKRVPVTSRRRALTLIELVVVIAILVALSGLVIPLIQGLGSQTNSAINATVVDDVNRSVGSFVALTGKQPDGWDSLLNTSGDRFTKLHPSLQASAVPDLLQVTTLSLVQVDSLNLAGIYNVYDADESSTVSPNANNLTARSLMGTVGGNTSGNWKVVKVSAAGMTALGGEFQPNRNSSSTATYDLVVLGLGGAATIQGTAMMQIPLVQSADPTHHYARACCVYMVPPSTADAATTFAAKYIGCLMPDGTTSRKNMENYNNSDLN